MLADELQEAGDPRGELIALQLANADPAKQRALITKHGEKWAGKLGKQFRELYFENGFLAGGMLAKGKGKFDDRARVVRARCRDGDSDGDVSRDVAATGCLEKRATCSSHDPDSRWVAQS